MREKLLQHFAPHHHSGRLVHHSHTSYAGLMFVIMLACIILMAFTMNVQAFDPSELPPPVTASTDVHGTVPGPAPKTAPTIQTPSNGQVVSSVPVSVLGKCQKDTLVKIFKNDIFAGGAFCDGTGSYKTSIDLLVGPNTLTAQSFNALDKGGPVSGAVNITYNLPAQTAAQVPGAFEPAKTPANQLLINTVNYHRGLRVGDELSWPLELVGGKPPYAISVGWGDGKTDLLSRGAQGRFDITHVYEKPGSGHNGSQTIVVKATDADGTTAYIQLVTIVSNGSKQLAAANSLLSGNLGIAWPLVLLAFIVVVSFFLGERREKHILHQKGLI
ncbi:MAG TPA: hypothetical protein VF272_00825 [Candidatus Saccharimonadia bacterium]